MEIEESCNDSHLVDIILSDKDINQLKKGYILAIECVKDETEILISKQIKK